MALLVSAAELQTYLGDPNLDTDQADLVLGGVDALVREWTRQHLEEVTNEEVSLDGTGTDVLLLPELPVTAVASIVDENDSSTLTEDTDYRWWNNGIVRRLAGNTWIEHPRRYTVTYTHGYATIPAAIKQVVLRVAARAVSNPSGHASETIGSYSYQAGFDTTARAAGLSDLDKRELSPWRIEP